ncbi:hypothetical protein [Amycolatopsis circi]|uniref:hypothetical protein n=1 Tax=Amycolatopsis circi TaxID=871959 RepID=UPI000E224183|nr:hypothetical protein [Amycolatopsis circi]
MADDPASRFFAERFRPTGVRLGLLVLSECDIAVEEAAAEVLSAHGLRPARRLAKLRPRLGFPAVTAREMVGFLERYGHEYCAAWLPVATADRQALDQAAIEQAGRACGCAIGWYRRS